MVQTAIENLFQSLFVLIPIFIWAVCWKGIALWRAARNSHKKWFVVLLILNTLGILEIIYTIFFSKKKVEKKIQ